MADLKNTASPTIVQMMARHYQALCAEFDQVEGRIWDTERAIKSGPVDPAYRNLPDDKALELMADNGTKFLRNKLSQVSKARDAAEESVHNNMAADLVDCLIQANRITILTESITVEDKESRETRAAVERLSVSITMVLARLTGADLTEFGGWAMRMGGHDLLPVAQDRRAAE